MEQTDISDQLCAILCPQPYRIDLDFDGATSTCSHARTSSATDTERPDPRLNVRGASSAEREELLERNGDVEDVCVVAARFEVTEPQGHDPSRSWPDEVGDDVWVRLPLANDVEDPRNDGTRPRGRFEFPNQALSLQLRSAIEIERFGRAGLGNRAGGVRIDRRARREEEQLRGRCASVSSSALVPLTFTSQANSGAPSTAGMKCIAARCTTTSGAALPTACRSPPTSRTSAS